jgi:hypothetical protein
MKNFLLVLAFIVASSANAQQLVDTANRWNVIDYVIDAAFTDRYFFLGDTLVSGVVYRKLYRDHGGYGLLVEYITAMREDEAGRVFVIIPDGTEALHYDFNLQQGEVFQGYDFNGCQLDLTVSSVDTIILLNGEARRRINFEYSGWWDIQSWIEGIGSTMGIAQMGQSVACWDGFTRTSLACWFRNDTLFYMADFPGTCEYFPPISVPESPIGQSLTIHPNPASDRVSFANPASVGVVRYEVMTALAEQILSGTTSNGTIPVGTLAPGAYLLRIHSSEGIFHARFVKE